MGHAGRLRHRRRRFGGVRARQSPHRRPRRPGGADRGGRARLEPAHPHPGRLHEAARPQDPDLELQGRIRSRHRRPGDPLSAGPRPRRLLLDQRPHLHPRPTRGFRSLGPARKSRLELGRCAPLLQAGRELAGRCRGDSWHRRVPYDVADERAAGGVPGDHRGCRRTRRRIPRRRQQPAAGRRRQHRLVPADPGRPAPRQRRANLPEAGLEAAQPCRS